MSLSKLISINTFSCKLKFIVTDNINQDISNIYKKHKLKNNEIIELEGIFVSVNGLIYYLLIDKKYLTHNTIAHEIYHAATMITADRDIDDEETRAWLCGYITEKIYDFIKSKKIEIGNGK